MIVEGLLKQSAASDNTTKVLGSISHGTIQPTTPLQSIDIALQQIFGDHTEETKLQKTRRIMGGLVTSVTDEDLEVYLTEFQYLIDTWLDEFEQQAFDGLTLKQLIQE